MYVIFLVGRFVHILINTVMQCHLLLCTSKLIITNVSNLLHMHHGLNFSQFVEQGQLVQMIGQHCIGHGTSQKYVFSEGGKGLPQKRTKTCKEKRGSRPSFGRDVKLGVPCLDAACIVGLN